MWVLNHITKVITRGQSERQESKLFSIQNDHLKDFLFFAPAFTMFLAIDVQAYYQVKHYKPIAFIDLPYKSTRQIGYWLAVINICVTFAGIALMYFTFADPKNFKVNWIFDLLLAKAFFWGPWLGWEYYDMLFEHLYYDTCYQLNQMIPGVDYFDLVEQTRVLANSDADFGVIATPEEQHMSTKTGAASPKGTFKGFESEQKDIGSSRSSATQQNISSRNATYFNSEPKINVVVSQVRSDDH
jgi:hypothetical protein